jgi:hypothetical protein
MHSIRRELAILTVPVTVVLLASACGTSTPKTQPATAAATTRPPATTGPARPASPALVVSIYGDLRFYITMVTPAAHPVGRVSVSLTVRAVNGGDETTQYGYYAPAIKALYFQFTLPPGRYRLKSLDLRGASLSPLTVEVPTGGPAFAVPRSGCAYIGLITLAFYRLPPGTLQQQAAVAGQLTHGKTGYLVYLKTGGLLGEKADVGLLPARERPAGSQTCPVRQAKF